MNWDAELVSSPTNLVTALDQVSDLYSLFFCFQDSDIYICLLQ